MNRSNDALDGTPFSHMKVKQLDNGRFQAEFPAVPQVPPQEGPSMSAAVEKAKQVYREKSGKGEIGR